MPDIYPSHKRGQIMSRISGRDTKPELLVRRYLHARGFRFRVNDPRYPGRPDLVLPKFGTVIFINGCFWHGHKRCKASRLPGTRIDFWKQKIATNVARDNRTRRLLVESGWRVRTVWQCELRSKTSRDNRLRRLEEEITRVSNDVSPGHPPVP